MNKGKILNDFENEGFSILDFSVEEIDLLDINRTFLENKKFFLDKKIEYDLSENGDYGEVGFRERVDDFRDKKFFYHFNPFFNNILEKDKIFFKKEKEKYFELNKKLLPVYKNLEKKFVDFLNFFDKNFQDKFMNKNGEVFCIYRILEYPPRDGTEKEKHKKEFLALPHTDIGAFTFAFFETDTGLTFEKKGKNISVEYKKNKMIFFPSNKNGLNFEPTTHFVLNGKQKDSSQSRLAHVFFI
jgi:nucleoside diphosphate kinase